MDDQYKIEAPHQTHFQVCTEGPCNPVANLRVHVWRPGYCTVFTQSGCRRLSCRQIPEHTAALGGRERARGTGTSAAGSRCRRLGGRRLQEDTAALGGRERARGTSSTAGCHHHPALLPIASLPLYHEVFISRNLPLMQLEYSSTFFHFLPSARRLRSASRWRDMTSS